MKILQVHNRYQNHGGEDVVVAAEHDMLLQKQHQVRQWIVHNDGIEDVGLLSKVAIARNAIWSREAHQQMHEYIQEFRPDVVHVHNTVPRLSPSIYSAARKSGVPVVQTLHNYRFVCPKSSLYRDGQICEMCVGQLIPYPAVKYACYRGSRIQSAVTATSLGFNRLRATYQNDIDIFIALTEFARNKFIESGLPAEKIVVKPNFITAADIQPGLHAGGYALFAGRLIPNKGIETVIAAWRKLDKLIPLKVLGDGELASIMDDLPAGVEYLGRQSREVVLELMRDATVLIFPSEWYEGFPMSIAEAFSMSLPVIAGRIGGPEEIVKDGYSGWHFVPGDADDLASIVQTAWDDLDEMKKRGKQARQQYDDLYTMEKNYLKLIEIYKQAIASFQSN